MTHQGSMNRWRRAIGSVLMALFLVLPHVGAFSSIAPPSPQCGEKCCRAKRACCCRKKAGSASSRPMASARACPPGCAQPLSVPTPLQLFSHAARQVLHAVFAASSLPVYCAAASCAANLAFALFQRPPPFRVIPRFI
jgi:hypothetical protein